MTEQHKPTPHCSELTMDELNHVSGGVVCITAHPTEIHIDSAKITGGDGGASHVGGGAGAGKIIIQGS